METIIGLVVAWKDSLIDFYQTYTVLLNSLAAIITIILFFLGGGQFILGVLVWSIKKIRPKPGPNPRLSLPPESTNINRYTTRTLAVVGRENEQKRLQDFLKCDATFRWLQLAGAGGQGKSRLALELILWAQERRWEAGFLGTTDLEDFSKEDRNAWDHWKPRRPHLIVLDYVIGREAEIKPMLHTLARRADAFRKSIRVLLLERQPWDEESRLIGSQSVRGRREPPMSVVSESRAEWFLKLTERYDGTDPALMDTRFETGAITLETLDADALVTIVQQVAQKEGHMLDLSESAIQEHLARIDSSGRPLYAYFLGQALVSGSVVSGWKREDLLTYILDRDQRSRWRNLFGDEVPCLGDGRLAERIAVMATITGGLDWAEAARQDVLPPADSNTRRQALVLVDGPTDVSATGPSSYIPSVQPDLLGEWFVLSAFHLNSSLLIETMDRAWRFAPNETASFLLRLAQDFPGHSITKAILEEDPPEQSSWCALARAASHIISLLSKAHQSIPDLIIEALTQAALDNDDWAMYSLGICYKVGIGVDQHYATALDWFRKSAEAGNGGAMSELGVCYSNGEGVKKEDKVALKWFRRAVELGEGLGMAHLGRCYSFGRGVKKSYEEAVAWFRKGAEAGNGLAMANLGYCLQNGEGVKKNYEEAVAWFRKGAEVGNGMAMAFLGQCLEEGKGVDPDLGEAVAWYKKGAEAGDGQAMSALGVCYEYGKVVEQDFSRALAWYKKGVEVGDCRSMCYLGLCYENGTVVEQDFSAAMALYLKGAESGYGRAMACLGFCYLRGEGGDKNSSVAVSWFRRGAETGDVWAMVYLGFCYHNGEGVGPDIAAAMEWYRKAAEAGSEIAKELLRGLESLSDMQME